jgi:predicted dehydrogenase
MKRRHFLGNLAVSGAAAGLIAKPVSAADKVTVGLMGCGGRGNVLLQLFGKRPDIEVKYLCDVDESKFGRVAATADEVIGKVPKRVTDFRHILDDPEVDVLISATPDHWHGLSTVLACQAGKHVYVEKPVSHNVWEGRKMVEAARKYNRVVQGGMQNRSSDYVRHAVEFVQYGKLGHVHQCRVVEMLYSKANYNDLKTIPMPDGLSWDIYCGPAPLGGDFKGTRINRMNWDFTAGPIIDDGIHQLDCARWILGVKYPNAVHSTGGNYVRKDGRDHPDSQIFSWEYPDMLLSMHGSIATPYIIKTPTASRYGDEFPDWLFNSTRVEVYGTDGMMIFARHGGGWKVFGPDGGEVASEHGRHQEDEHVENFVQCVRSGARPNCDIEEGHISAALGHIGNISYRLGHRQLQFDGKREQFINDDEANGLIKRNYRQPWVIPEDV